MHQHFVLIQNNYFLKTHQGLFEFQIHEPVLTHLLFPRLNSNHLIQLILRKPHFCRESQRNLQLNQKKSMEKLMFV